MAMALQLIDLPRLKEDAAIRRRYFETPATPHIVLDGLLRDDRLRELGFDEELRQVRGRTDLGRFDYINQVTETTVGQEGLPPIARRIVEELHSPEWIRFVEELTGIRGLRADPDLANGGVFFLRPGGFM